MLERAGRFLAYFSLVVMTAALACYHWLLINGVIPAFLGGFRGAAGAVLFVPAAVLTALIFLDKPSRITRADILAICVTLLMMVFAVAHIPGDYTDVPQANLIAATQVFVAYFTFRFLQITEKAAYALLTLLTVIVLSLGLGDVGANAIAARSESPEAASHQGLAMAYLFVWLLAASLTTGAWRHLIYAVGVVALFYNGARSELIAVVIAIVVSECMRDRRNSLLIVAAGALIFIFYAQISTWIVSEFPTNRFAILLMDMAYDDSLLSRRVLDEQAWRVIELNPLLGDYAAYGHGEYAHNIISAWADFGLFGFAFFLICIGYPVWASLQSFARRWGGPLILLLATTSIASAVLFAFAKFYTYPLLGVSLALAARYLHAVAVGEKVPQPHWITR